MSATHSSLLVRRELNGEWQVWLGLAGEHPVLDLYGFVVGVGETRDAAIADAVQNLGQVAQLQAPVGVAPEEHEIAFNVYEPLVVKP